MGVNTKTIPAILRRHLPEIIPAFVFVMAGCRNRLGRAAFQAFSTGVLRKMETVFVMIRI
jgi:hypothetical protein